MGKLSSPLPLPPRLPGDKEMDWSLSSTCPSVDTVNDLCSVPQWSLWHGTPYILSLFLKNQWLCPWLCQWWWLLDITTIIIYCKHSWRTYCTLSITRKGNCKYVAPLFFLRAEWPDSEKKNHQVSRQGIVIDPTSLIKPEWFIQSLCAPTDNEFSRYTLKGLLTS